MRPFVASALAGLLLGCATAEPPPVKQVRMESPSYLTSEARTKIKAMMQEHRVNMSGLFSSLLVLDKVQANTYATAIAAMPRLQQDPKLPKDERIPERVLELQGELHQRAEELIAIVNKPDRVRSSELAGGFAALARVCVTCHSQYLYPED